MSRQAPANLAGVALLLASCGVAAWAGGFSQPQGSNDQPRLGPPQGGSGLGGFSPPQGGSSGEDGSIPADGTPSTDPLFRFDASDPTCLIQGGLTLDGSSGVKETLSSDPIGSYPFTVAICVTPTDNNTNSQFLWQAASDSEDTTYHIMLRQTGRARARASVAGTFVDHISADNVIVADQSNWVFVTYRSSGITMAVNDTYYSEGSSAPPSYPTGKFDRINVGAYGWNSLTPSGFVVSGGVIHQIYVIGREVSVEEVRDVVQGVPFETAVSSSDRIRNWRLASATDTVASATLATFTGSGATFASGDVVYAMSNFGSVHRGSYTTAASGNYLRLATLPGGLDPDDYTIMWFSAGGAGSGLHSQISISDGTKDNYERVHYTNSTLTHVFDSGGSGGVSHSGAVGGSFSDGRYGSMALTKRSSSDREIYSQGVSVGTDTTTRDNGSAYSEIQIGAEGDGTSGQGGHARLMVWSPALTDEQVALANEGADPRNIGATCVAFYRLSGLTDELGGADLTVVGSPTATTEWVSNSVFSFRQRDSTKRPSYSAETIVFDGLDEVMEMTKQSNPLVINAPYTITTKLTSALTRIQTIVGTGSESAHDDEQHELGTNGSSAGLFRTEAGATSQWAKTGLSVESGDNTISVTLSAAGLLNVRVNGANSTVTDATKTDPSLANRMLLGAGVGSAGAAGDFFQGSIYRIEVLPRVVGPAELATREAR